MSMVNVQLKLSTKFVRFSFVGKKKSKFKSTLLDDTLQVYIQRDLPGISKSIRLIN